MSTQHSEQLDELFAALSAAQAEFTAIPKDSSNPFFKSKYAGLPIVVEKASPILTKHGLAVSQLLGCDGEGRDTLTTWLAHKSGQWISDSMRLHLVKEDPQGHGSATTYARRYAYMAALGLVADEDDDGNRASPTAASANSTKRSPSPRSSKAGAEKRATSKQLGLLSVRAKEQGLEPSQLADLLLRVATGEAGREWETPESAKAWLDRQLEQLPARLVNPLLEAIASSHEPNKDEEIRF